MKKWEDYNKSVAEALAQKHVPPEAKPYLICVPPNLIRQWITEVHKLTTHLILKVYHGDYRTARVAGVEVIKTKLDVDNELFDRSPVRGRTVIITSYATWNARHGLAARQNWFREKSKKKTSQSGSKIKWPGDLSEKFSTVVLDEAHQLRNPESETHRAIQWLKPDFYLLLTATPFYNALQDFRGYVPLLFKQPSSYTAKHLADLGLSEKSNVFSPDIDPAAHHLRFTEEAMNKFVLATNVDSEKAGMWLRSVLPELMIRRTLSSCIPFDTGKQIGSDIPPSQRKVIEVKFHPEEAIAYQQFSRPHLRGLFVQSEDDPSRYVWNMKKYRMLTLLSTWLGFQYISNTLKAGNVTAALTLIRNNPARLIDAWSAKITSHETVVENAVKGFYRRLKRPSEETRRSARLELLLRGAPKMRVMLEIIRDQVLLFGEKAIVWVMFPGEQVYVEAVLHEAGIDAYAYHAGLAQGVRDKLVEDFNGSGDTHHVLVCSYMVTAAGLNLQTRCRNVHLYSAAMSVSVIEQSIGRVVRVGQNFVVFIYDYRAMDSFHETMVARMHIKAMAGMLTELNDNMFSMEPTHAGVDMKNWVVRDGKLHQLKDEESRKEDDLHGSDDIIEALIALVSDTASAPEAQTPSRPQKKKFRKSTPSKKSEQKQPSRSSKDHGDRNQRKNEEGTDSENDHSENDDGENDNDNDNENNGENVVKDPLVVSEC
jgi:SNF2 family DNA or RNA helicase